MHVMLFSVMNLSSTRMNQDVMTCLAATNYVDLTFSEHYGNTIQTCFGITQMVECLP